MTARRPPVTVRSCGHQTLTYRHSARTVSSNDLVQDKQFMIWLKRDSGGYWPSVHEELPAPATALAYAPHDRRAYIGLATGAILIYSIQEDFNAITYVYKNVVSFCRLT